MDVDSLRAQGDVPTPGSVIEEMLEVSVEAVQIIPQERIFECIAEQESRRFSAECTRSMHVYKKLYKTRDIAYSFHNPRILCFQPRTVSP